MFFPLAEAQKGRQLTHRKKHWPELLPRCTGLNLGTGSRNRKWSEEENLLREKFMGVFGLVIVLAGLGLVIFCIFGLLHNNNVEQQENQKLHVG